MGTPVAETRPDGDAARAFARVAADYIRRTTWPTFTWRTESTPSPRHVLETPLDRARVAAITGNQLLLRGQHHIYCIRK